MAIDNPYVGLRRHGLDPCVLEGRIQISWSISDQEIGSVTAVSKEHISDALAPEARSPCQAIKHRDLVVQELRPRACPGILRSFCMDQFVFPQ